MFRFLTILLLFGLAITSGAIGFYLNGQKNDESETREPDYVPMTAKELIENPPWEQTAIEVTDMRLGHKVIGLTHDREKDWEEAWVPVFTNEEKAANFNCVCILYRSTQLQSESDCEDFLLQASIQGHFLPAKQELSEAAFSKLAQTYNSLDYSRCLLLVDDAPVVASANYKFLGAIGAFAFFLMLAGWQSFSMVGSMKSKIAREKNVKPVSDAAGLSELFESENQDGKDDSTTSTGAVDINESGASFIEKWKSEND